MNKEPLVYIVILNFNGYSDTVQCVKSLENIIYSNYKIVIVDNNSSDNSYELLKSEFNNHVIIKSSINEGFGAGNNIGIKYALENDAEYILLLNNDTIVKKDFLGYLVDDMKNKNVGMVGGKIYYYDNNEIIWSAGGYINRFKVLGCHYGLNEKDADIYNKKKNVSFLTGCCQLISREAFEKIGMYSEEYFLYLEDVEYCMRMIDMNYKIVYEPKSIIYHKVSASTGELSELYLYYFTRNRLILMKEMHKNKISRIIVLINYLIIRLLSIFKYGKKGKAIINGIFDYYKGIVGEKSEKQGNWRG